MQTGKQVIIDNPKINFDGNVENKANLDTHLLAIQALFEEIFGTLSFDSLEINKFGIICSPEDKKALLAMLFNAVLKNETVITKSIQQTNTFLQKVQLLVQNSEAGRIRVTPDSTETSTLSEAIKLIPNHITIDDNKVVFKGLVPIGTQISIAPKRIVDFDNSGKGKIDTDVYGWSIRNGQNNTDNALGKYVKYGTTNVSMGTLAGSNSYVVEMANIKSFSMNVKGALSNALGVIKATLNFIGVERAFALAGSRKIVITADTGVGNINKDSNSIDVTHSHSHNFTVDHSNPNPTPLNIDLEHIKELPIVFQGFK